MKCKVVSRVIALGRNRYRLNDDGSWSALAFGFFINKPHATLPSWQWINIPENKVPSEVKRAAE